MAIDLKSLDAAKAAETGAEMALRHPVTGKELADENGNKAVIMLVGADSRTYRQASHMISNRNLQRMKRSRTQLVEVEDVESDRIELIARCTTGWRNIAINGEDLEFSLEAARRLYDEHRWVGEQVDAFIGDRGNFLRE